MKLADLTFLNFVAVEANSTAVLKVSFLSVVEVYKSFIDLNHPFNNSNESDMFMYW